MDLDTDSVFEKIKNWVKYLAVGIWSLLLFGIVGFSLIVYFALRNLEDLKLQNPHPSPGVQKIHGKNQG